MGHTASRYGANELYRRAGTRKGWHRLPGLPSVLRLHAVPSPTSLHWASREPTDCLSVLLSLSRARGTFAIRRLRGRSTGVPCSREPVQPVIPSTVRYCMYVTEQCDFGVGIQNLCSPPNQRRTPTTFGLPGPQDDSQGGTSPPTSPWLGLQWLSACNCTQGTPDQFGRGVGDAGGSLQAVSKGRKLWRIAHYRIGFG
jgi:hypothetical protein